MPTLVESLNKEYGVNVEEIADPTPILWGTEHYANSTSYPQAVIELRRLNERRAQQGRMPAFPIIGTPLWKAYFAG